MESGRIEHNVAAMRMDGIDDNALRSLHEMVVMMLSVWSNNTCDLGERHETRMRRNVHLAKRFRQQLGVSMRRSTEHRFRRARFVSNRVT